MGEEKLIKKYIFKCSFLEGVGPPRIKHMAWSRRVTSVISSVEWHPLSPVERYLETILQLQVPACITHHNLIFSPKMIALALLACMC